MTKDLKLVSEAKSAVQNMSLMEKEKRAADMNFKLTMAPKRKVKVILDKVTGEITEDVSYKSRFKVREPGWAKMYVEEWHRLNGLSGKQIMAFLVMIKRATYNGRVVMNGAVREEICNEVGISRSTLTNILSELRGRSLILRRSDNDFYIDPSLSAKGRWIDVKDNVEAFRILSPFDKRGQRYDR
jgi:hypothetical protein